VCAPNDTIITCVGFKRNFPTRSDVIFLTKHNIIIMVVVRLSDISATKRTIDSQRNMMGSLSSKHQNFSLDVELISITLRRDETL